MKYTLIDKNYYENNKKILTSIINEIWIDSTDANKAVQAIIRSHGAEKDSFHYAIILNNEMIGITGYYGLNNFSNFFGLNHHGIIKKYRGKGYGLSTIHGLVEYVKEKDNINIKGLVELIPKGNNEIKIIFEKMGFQKLSQQEISKVELINNIIQKGYYNSAYILKIKKK